MKDSEKNKMIHKIRFFKGIVTRKLHISLNPYPYRKYTDKYKCIFIHIPKTAGTSILSAISEEVINRDHASFEIYEISDKKKFNEYFKFTFVRNPWDRIVSTYEYLKQGGNGAEDLYLQKLIRSNYNTFDKFVLHYLNKEVIHEIRLLRPQYLYVYDYKGSLKVDYLGRFENLSESFEFITNKLELGLNLTKTNSSKRGGYSDYYIDNNVKLKIDDLYKKDIFLFKYKFEQE